MKNKIRHPVLVTGSGSSGKFLAKTTRSRNALRLCGMIFLILLCFNSANAETITKSHAVSIYGDVKYPANFQHYDYVNPDAPKRGTLVTPDVGNFDSFNQFILKGSKAADAGLLFDTLMSASEDETATNYPLIAESAEWPSSNEWIIFNLNPAAKFSDGSPVTADDVVFSFNTLI